MMRACNASALGRSARWAGLLAVAAVTAVSWDGALRAQTGPRYDVILRHGTVVDGTGAPRFDADVAVAGDHIVAIGNLAGATAETDIDAKGLVVAPGFINIHSHATAEGLPTAVNMLVQGVTTEIIGADGRSGLDIAAHLDALATGRLAVNVGTQVGFNSIWAEVVGQADRRPSAADLAKMRALVQSNLERGAWGVSAGLDYKPGYFAKAEEVVQVVSVASPWRTNFPNHDRLTPETGYSSKLGINETVAIGKESGLVPLVTHMKVQGHEQGSADAVLASMRATTREGTWVAADAYPYLAGQTGLGALTVPGWAQEGGRDRMLERFKDPVQRAKIVKEVEEALQARFGGATGAGVYLPETAEPLTDVAKKMGTSTGETILRLLEQGSPSAILTFGAEADLVKILQYPATSIACDCGASLETRTHPRYFGTFPRVLGHYVRETGALTLEDAVRKSSGLPASTIGMIDRGLIAVGMAADIAVFDPRTIIDHATYAQPTLPPDGMRWVLVNGVVSLRDGQAVDAHAGRTLRRSAHMPSRPTRFDVDRRVRAAGVLTAQPPGGTDARQYDVQIEVTQGASARAAAGRVRLTDRASKAVVDAKVFGMLQTANGWATLSGLARAGAAATDEPFTLVVDVANPLAPRAGPFVAVSMGSAVIEGTFTGATAPVITPGR